MGNNAQKNPGFKLLCKKEHPPVEQVPRNPRKTAIFSFHLKLNGTLPTDPLRIVAIELLDTQVKGSVQWVLLEISWYFLPLKKNG